MATFHFKIPDQLTKQLEKLANVDEIAPKMIDAGIPIVQGEMVRRADAHRRTGAMSGSIKPTKPKRTGSGHSAVVRPTGRDGRGTRNMEKMMYLEYGTSHQPSTPVIAPTVAATESSVIEAMQEVFNAEVESK